MGLITGPPQSQSIEKVWLVVYQTTLALLWVELVVVMVVTLVMDIGYRGPRVTITGKDTSHRVMAIPVRRVKRNESVSTPPIFLSSYCTLSISFTMDDD